jgi:hypothetical protein
MRKTSYVLMGEKEDVGSFLSIVKRRNVQYARSAGVSAAETKELSGIRGADEESYKVLLLPLLAQILTQLVLANDKVLIPYLSFFPI